MDFRYHGSEKSTYPKFQISWISDIMDQKNRPTQSFRYHGFQISWIRKIDLPKVSDIMDFRYHGSEKSTYPKFQISWISDIMDHKNRPTQSFRYHGFQISWIIKMFDLPKVSGIMDQRLLFVFFLRVWFTLWLPPTAPKTDWTSQQGESAFTKQRRWHCHRIFLGLTMRHVHHMSCANVSSCPSWSWQLGL